MESISKYHSAVKLIDEASKLDKNSQLTQKLHRAAVVILWDLVSEGGLETPTRWDAQLLLVQQLLEHTTSFKEATTILRALKVDELTPEYAIRCKFLEVELEIQQHDLRKAQTLSDDLLREIRRVGNHGFLLAFVLLQMRLGSVPQSLIDEVKDLDALALFDILLNEVRAYHRITHPEILMLDVLRRITNALKYGLEESDTHLVDEIKDIDWTSLWPQGRAQIELDGELVYMSLDAAGDQLLPLLYILLTNFHLRIDDGNMSLTKSWMSEMLQSVSNSPPSHDVLIIVYFYAVLVYHHCNKTSARDILLEQMVHLNADPSLIAFCRGVIAQQSGNFDQAMHCFDEVVSNTPALRSEALLNMLAMAPNSQSYQQRLSSSDLTEPQRNIQRLIKALTKPDSMTLLEYKELVENLKADEMLSPLERALYLLIKPDPLEGRRENLENAVKLFRQLGLKDWETCATQMSQQLA